MVVCPSEFTGLGVPAVNQETAFDNRLPAKVSAIGPRITFQYVAGGYGNLVEAVAGVIRENGGRIHTSRPVQRVVVEEGRARGVERESSLSNNVAEFIWLVSRARRMSEQG